MKKLQLICILVPCLYLSSFAQVYPTWISNGHFPDAVASTAYAVAVDNSGNIFSSGGAGYNYVIKQDAGGSMLWLQFYDCGDTIPDAPSALCIDNQGNAYITFMKHKHFTGGSYWSIAVQKYSATDGTILWTSELPESMFNAFEWQVRPKYMTIDENYLYVAGTKFEPGTSIREILTMKLDFNGNILWTATHSGNGLVNDVANAKSITVDNNGNVYVAGDAWNASIDYCVVKYDPDGSFLWDAFLDDETNQSTDIAESVLVDDNGNVYVTGYSNLDPGGKDILTAKYNQNGVLQWKRYYENPAYRTNNAYYLEMSESGDLYVGGYSYDVEPYPGSGKDYVLLKYDPSGNLLWDARYDHNNFGDDHPFDFSMGPEGNIYICGYTMKQCHVYKFINVVKINPQGVVEWDVRVPDLYGTPWGITAIGDDDFVVAAGAFDSIQVDDATTIRYQAAPPPVYEAEILDVYFGSQIAPPVFDYENRKVIATVHDTANILALVPYITRSPHSCMYPEDEIPTSFIETVWYNITSFDETTENWWRIAVEGGHVGVDVIENETIRIFPNPAKETLWLADLNMLNGNKEIGFYDLNGRKLIEKHLPALLEVFELDVSSLTNGIYFCRITSMDLSITKKIIIQR